MKTVLVSPLALLFVMSVSHAAALPLELGGDRVAARTPSLPDGCSESTIADCVASSGLEGSICFAQLCMVAPQLNQLTSRQPEEKRDHDECNEESLIQCAIGEWRQPETCFQELCL
jgi:hypothetical protein